MKNLSFVIIHFFFGSFINHAQIPARYYNSTEGLNGGILKAALNDIIDEHI